MCILLVFVLYFAPYISVAQGFEFLALTDDVSTVI